MQLRPLGTSSLSLTPLGFGSFKIGRKEGAKYAASYDLSDDATAERILNGVLDLGMNWIDTAPAYGIAEGRIGTFLSHRNHEFIISTKVGERFSNGCSTFDFSTAAICTSIDRSCRLLHRDVLDIVFIHSDGRDLAILNETDAVASLMALKQAGRIRAIGLSGKTVAGARAALQWADVIMVEYHADDDSHADVMHEAQSQGVGVIIKKALASGSHAPATAIALALRHPAVTAIAVGGLNLEHMAANIRAAEGHQ
ncbi:MAG: aldo/keto reductase [Phycisphaerales bacterium]